MGSTDGTNRDSSERRSLVGRAAELDLLRQLLESARAGHSGFVSLVGDPGIGKSLLGEEFLAMARSAGGRVGLGRCHPGAAQVAFRPWLQVFRDVLEQPDAAGLDELLGAGSVAGQAVESDEVGGSRASLATRVRLFDAVVRTLAERAELSPLVLLFEDVHWADSASLLLLQFVAREIAALGVVIVVTHRPEQIYTDQAFTRARLAWERESFHRRIDLRGLQPDEVWELVRHESARVVAGEITPEVVEGSGGNPLLIIQTVRHLLDRKGFRSSAPSTAPSTLPTDVSDVILHRIEAMFSVYSGYAGSRRMYRPGLRADSAPDDDAGAGVGEQRRDSGGNR